MNNPVRVCPCRDIECGRNPKSWCRNCPNWAEITTVSVKSEGLPPMIMIFDAKSVPATPVPPPFNVEHAWLRAQAFAKIRIILESEASSPQMVERIRNLINDCP